MVMLTLEMGTYSTQTRNAGDGLGKRDTTATSFITHILFTMKANALDTSRTIQILPTNNNKTRTNRLLLNLAQLIQIIKLYYYKFFGQDKYYYLPTYFSFNRHFLHNV